MNNLAIIPARSGSKGLPDKNILELAGIPLMGYSINAAKESNLFSDVMVSTDSEKYAEVARAHGASVPFLRSIELSTDVAGSWDVVKEVLKNYMQMGKFFDSICLLQPTSPLRQEKHIREAYSLFEEKKADAITSVCEMEHSPLWSTTLDDDLSLIEFRKKIKQSGPRQSLDKYYRINGAIYIRKITYNYEPTLLCDKEYAYIMNRLYSVDIDTIDDFRLAEFLMAKENKKF